jgi:hypothetical protein
LYNFDIDGDLLKPEHQNWLKDHVVPQLGNPNVKIELRGQASRTGSDAHNLELSRRRVTRVLNFLHANGPVFAETSVTFVGEDDARRRGEEDNTEDELVRAVIVKVEHSLHRLVPVVFDRVVPLRGFDPGADPPWVMLKAGLPTRRMEVENAEGLFLVSSKPAVAVPQPTGFRRPGPVPVIRQTQQFDIVAGLADDNLEAEIRAVGPGGDSFAKLAVSVLPRRTVTCAFHYVCTFQDFMY